MSQNVNDNENLNDPNDQNPLEIEGTAAELAAGKELPGEINYEEGSDKATVHVSVTADVEAAPPVQSETIQEPMNEGDVPKEGMDIPHPDVDALFDCTIIGAGPTGLYGSF